jgi:hypothetical protein
MVLLVDPVYFVLPNPEVKRASIVRHLAHLSFLHLGSHLLRMISLQSVSITDTYLKYFVNIRDQLVILLFDFA